VARLILDTSLLVGAERDGIEAIERLVDDDDDVAVATITAAELLVGVELAHEGRRAARQEFVEVVLEAISVEDYDLDVAAAHASLLVHTHRTGSPRGAHDLIIAATGRARNREVLSADLAGFADLPGVVLRAD
jgi:tRNA(fMet)-specific endonuclease VapC